MYYKLPVKERLKYMEAFRKANPSMSYHDMVKDYNNTFEKYGNGGKVEVNAGGEKHLVYKKKSPTGNGKGIEGHIMVTHPTKDKGKWDTIDLTAITNYKVKTLQNGIESTKKWHEENPEYAYGGIQKYDDGGKKQQNKTVTYTDKALFDKAYKNYKDSLNLHLAGLEKINFWKKYPGANNETLNKIENIIDEKYPISSSKDIFGSNNIEATGWEIIGKGSAKRGVPQYTKPVVVPKFKKLEEVFKKEPEVIVPKVVVPEIKIVEPKNYNKRSWEFTPDSKVLIYKDAGGKEIGRETYSYDNKLMGKKGELFEVNENKRYGGIQRFDNGGKTKEPIVVSNKNDPRLRSYNDSLALYNLSQKAKRIFDVDPMDPTLESYNKKADALASKSKIKPTRLQLIGYSEPYKKDFDPYSMQEAWMVTYKKPVQPVVYKKPEDNNEKSKDKIKIYNDKESFNKAKKAYDDSLNFHLTGIDKVNFWKNNPEANKANLNKVEDVIDKKYGYYDRFTGEIRPTGWETIGTGNAKRNVPQYKKPEIMPVYEEPVKTKSEVKSLKNSPSKNNSSEYLEMRKLFLPSNRNVEIIESKESSKKVIPNENKTYSKRQWDFNSPSGKIMRYYDNAGKELWNETYDHYTGKLISTSKK